MHRFSLSLLLTAAALLLSTDARAFTYDEATQGDLNFVYEHPAAFDLDPGDNIISGSRTVSDLSDKDVFGFAVPEGHVLQSISIEFEITEVTPSIEVFWLSFGLYTLPPVGPLDFAENHGNAFHAIYADENNSDRLVETSPLTLVFRAGLGPPPYIGPPIGPLPPGRYALNDGYGSNSFFPRMFAFDYALHLNVVPIPEPSTAVMMLLGLLGLGWRGREGLARARG